MDVILILFDDQGIPLGGNNNCSDYSWYFGHDKGSENDTNGRDSYFTWKFSKTGLYYLGIAIAGTDAEEGGFSPFEPLNNEGTYILNIALQAMEEPDIDLIDDTDPDDDDGSDYSNDWYNFDDLGLCPYIYVFNGESYLQDIEIIPNQVGKNNDRLSEVVLKHPVIIDGTLTIEIREIKEEISYIDYLSIKIHGKEISPLSGPAVIGSVDGTYIILKKGDSISLKFLTGNVEEKEIIIRAKGYYILQ
jgi:hypothetical protein